MSEHPISQRRRDQLLETAADWVTRIQDGELSSEALDAWAQWLSASPDHQRAFDDVQALWGKLGRLPYVVTESDTSKAADENYDGDESVRVWLRRRDGVSTTNGSQRRYWAAAAAVVAAIGITTAGLMWWTPNSATDLVAYRTVTAQHQTVTLPDGSTMELGAASVANVQYTDGERGIELLDGIAFFTVTKNAERPFVVRAGGGTVTAIGTAFSVQRRDGEVSVVVSDGLVEVAKPIPLTPTVSLPDPQRRPNVVQLPAGQRVEFSPTAGLELPTETDVEAATAWRDGQLVFQNEALSEAISDVNRYSRIPIELHDEELAKLQINGYVMTNQVDGWLDGLEVVLPVTVSRFADRVVLSYRGNESIE